MGKRSDFERIPRDLYDTPAEAVVPLTPFIKDVKEYWEPCVGNWALVDAIKELGVSCYGYGSDINGNSGPACDATKYQFSSVLKYKIPFITNPPWDRPVLHAIIDNLSKQAPTWLLIDADWAHTKQTDMAKRGLKTVPELMKHCRKIVAVGRVKWIPNSKHTGKDNCCWYLFDQRVGGATIFYPRKDQ